MADKKSAGIVIVRCLLENTSKSKGVTINEIEDYSKREFGLELNRKTISGHLEKIDEIMGDRYCFIKENVGGKNYYSLLIDDMDITDATLISTSLYGNNSISQKDADKLTEKVLSSFNSSDRSNVLNSVIKEEESRRMADMCVSNGIMEVIVTAIVNHKNIAIDFSRNPISDSKNYRKHILSPYKILPRSGYLYLFANCHEHNNDVSKFRIDRIVSAKLLENSEYIKPTLNGAKIIEEAKINRTMNIGTSIHIMLEYEPSVEGIIYDRYGTNVDIRGKSADGFIKISVEDILSDTLLSWLFLLGERVRVTGDSTLLKAYKEKLVKINDIVK